MLHDLATREAIIQFGFRQRATATAQACSHRKDLCNAMLASWYRDDPGSRDLEVVAQMTRRPGKIFHDAPGQNPFRELWEMLEGPAPDHYSDPETLTALYADYYVPHVAFDPAALLRAWDQCGPPEHSAEECRRGLERARGLLDHGA